MAASSGELRVLRSLARLGADMEAPDRYGETPMHLAVLFPTLSVPPVLSAHFRIVCTARSRR
jgi:ankyrin repeat protein